MKRQSREKWKHRWNRFQGVPIEFDLTFYQQLLDRIDHHHFKHFTDSRLKTTAGQIRAKAKNGEILDNLLCETFALVRETSRRTIGLNPYDVQMMAGIALHQGKTAEMQTGEGKTLAAVAPAALNALTGRGVHVLTFNDYLARRDAAWMGPIYEFCGLTVGCIQEGMDTPARQTAYHADITYATAKEAGFDFLRDFLCLDPGDIVHRPLNFALVDEADSLFIDEARVPLVIAGETEQEEEDPRLFPALVKELIPGEDFKTDEGAHNIYLTEQGLQRMESRLACGSLHSSENLGLLTRLNLAIHAQFLLKRDVDYIVRNGRIEVVDEFTGRVVEDRHWPDGLQAALEAKEGISRHSKGAILGSITLQHFFGLYPKLCGMTATAQPAANELKTFYQQAVVVLPPNRPCVRQDMPDLIFCNKSAKTRALIREIRNQHQLGRPVLVGTASVEESEQLSSELSRQGIPCRVLNAKNDEREAGIIAQAGMPGAVTISTNMAGRGTDIKLGGEDEKHRSSVVEQGGLLVIGTNRHESRRIDDQLRGRAGRQGDPGSSQFFVSLEDDLLVRYGIGRKISSESFPEDPSSPLEDKQAAKDITHGQRVVEGENFNIRKILWKYSVLLETQRKAVQSRRREILEGKLKTDDFESADPGRYQTMVSLVGRDQIEELERRITLLSFDSCWRDHLALIADIKEGVHLVQIAGESPREEFLKRVSAAFFELENQIRDRKLEMFYALPLTKEGLDPERSDLKGPSSTWTYLVNEEQFGFWTKMLMGKNVAIAAAGVASFLPIALLISFFVWIRKKWKRKSK